MLHCMALVRTDVSEQHIASIIRVTRIGELGKLAIISNRSKLRRIADTEEIFLRCVLRLLVTVNVIPSSPILVTLMMEAKRSSERSVLTRATHRHIHEDGNLRSHRRENLTYYRALTGWTL
jgi:hypothetical protein